MAFCTTTCTNTLEIPVPADPCANNRTLGTISRLVFIDCGIPEFTNINDPAEWQALVTACRVKATNLLSASKAESAATTARLAGCLTEETTGQTHTVTFADNYIDCPTVADGWLAYNFWNYIRANQRGLSFGWLICGENCGILQGFREFSIQVSQVIPETKEEAINFAGTITYTGISDMPAQPVDQAVIDVINSSVNTACPTP